MRILLPLMMLCLSAQAQAQSSQDQPTSEEYQADALQLGQQIEQAYAYRDRFEDEEIPFNATLQAEAEAVTDARSLLRYVERALLLLQDHHAITGSSLSDSWAVVPSYADLWIIFEDDQYVVDAVRAGSPAEDVGVVAGMRLTGVDGLTTAAAVRAFWQDLGHIPEGEEAMSFAARVLAAGRRDRPRRLAFAGSGSSLDLELPNLYAIEREDMPLVTLVRDGNAATIRINDSLGNDETIAAFDIAMREVQDASSIVIDLTETPGGGNTRVARAIMGWFITEAMPYQMHDLPAEQRQTGIARRWMEYVLPREGQHYDGEVSVRVGRWTGSMGEGLAIGMHAFGFAVEGHEMAGLLGAIYDLRLSNSQMMYKLPVERLSAVDGTPREDFVVD